MKIEKTQNIPADGHFPLAELFGFDIRPYTELHRFQAEEHILCEGSRPEFLYYLINGRTKLYLTHGNGRVTLINFMTAP